jgi:hypothetical protein
MTITLTAMAQALATRPSPFHPKWLTGLSWVDQWGNEEPYYSGSCLDNATSAQAASLLGATVIQLIPRLCWDAGNPNKVSGSEQDLVNFFAWPAPTANAPNAVSVLQACDIGAYIGMPVVYGNMTWAQSMELVLSVLVPGSTVSDATLAALSSDPGAQNQFSTMVATQQAIYIPPVAA